MKKVTEITLDDVKQILAIYTEVMGGGTLNPECLLEDIKDGEAFFDGYRIGCRWERHSKLQFRRENGILLVDFSENFDPRDRKPANEFYRKALAAADIFKKRVKDEVLNEVVKAADPKTLAQIKRELSDSLAEIQGINGIDLAPKSDSKKACFVVNVFPEITDRDKAKIPTTFQGFDVIIQVIADVELH
jgi:hypothetical protein